MRTPDTLFEALKELMQVGNPGLVTKEDVAELEGRLDELDELVAELEERLSEDEPEEPAE